MSLIGRIRAAWLRAEEARRQPIEVQAALTAPLYARPASLMVGHVAGICLGVLAMIRTGGQWPTAFTVASLVVLVVRLQILRCVRHLRTGGAPAEILRWRGPYQAVGIVWSTLSSALCVTCVVAGGDEIVRTIAITLSLGVTAGISSRNAGTPRFALTQIGIWGLPVMIATPLLGPWYAVISMMIFCYLVALTSLVRQLHGDTLLLIAMERDSRQGRLVLAEREAELRALFENAAAGVMEIDVAAGVIARVNREACRMLGQTEAELMANRDPGFLVHPDEVEAHAAYWAGIVGTGVPMECERRFLLPDGTILTTSLHAAVSAADGDGRPTRLVAILQDVGARKAAEAKLRANEEVLRLSMDIGRIGNYRRDHVARQIDCGLQARMIFGLPTDVSIPVAEAEWAVLVVPEDMARVTSEFAAVYAARAAFALFEYRFTHPRDGVRYIETRCRIEYDAAGKPLVSVGIIIDITDRRVAEVRFAHLAHHDPLTGLPNRALFRIRLDDALARAARGERFAVCYLDLDHFKYVNDVLGHPVGDALLQAVTARLLALLRPTDTTARLGGDEFAVIQSDITHTQDVMTVAQRLIDSVSAPYEIEGHHIVIGTSMGIAISPDDGMDANLLLREADTALYAAKEAGRGRYRFFEQEMDQRMQARRAMELDLRAAMKAEGFELYYQPIMSVATRRLLGFEALLRWNHPERGMVMPDQFIGLAESNGMIVPIGEWVLHRACREAAGWEGDAHIAVNLSAMHFTNSSLVATVAAALEQSGLDPGRLDLEITESAMMTDTEITLDKLHRLKALGVGISMDDFGTGYSSLSYLQRFPFDKVKIDRSFITPLGQSRESAAIVGAVIALCASLDMRTTGEGVETESQFATLAGIGCTEAQGYLFSPPRPAREVPGMIETLGEQVRV